MFIRNIAFLLAPMAAFAAPAASSADPALHKPIKYSVSGFSAQSTPHGVTATYDFNVESVDAPNPDRSFKTECSGATQTYQSLGFLEGPCKDKSVFFKFEPQKNDGGFKVTVIKQWEQSGHTYNDTAHHLIPQSHYHKHAGTVPTGVYVSIDKSKKWNMEAQPVAINSE